MAIKESIRYTKKIPTSIDYRRMSMLEAEQRDPALVRSARVRAQAQADADKRANAPLSHYELLGKRDELRMKLQEKAKFDAEMFEKQYTQKQKMDIAKGRRLMGAIDQYPDWDEAGKDAAKEAIFKKYILGVIPTELPRTSSHPRGQGVGDFWDQNGVTVSRKLNGETWQVDERKTARGQASEHELKATQEAAKLQTDLAKEKRKAAFDLMSKGVFNGVDEIGRPKMRMVDANEARSTVDQLYNEQQQDQQQQRKILPSEVKRAKAVVKRYRDRYKSIDEIPEGMRQQFFSAVDLLESQKAEAQDMQQISSDEDYRALPSGAEFIDPEGVPRRKP